MASDNGVANDKYAVAVAKPDGQFVNAPYPAFAGDFVCWGKDEDGNISKVWEAPWHNMVMDQGRALILNKVFANGFANHTNQFMFLHNAATATNSSGNTWGNISASQVGGYSANMMRLQFTTAGTDSNQGTNYMTSSASFGFTTSTYTVNGAGIMFYTATSCATNFATSDGRLYCYGSFAASQQVQNGNTLSVTVTVSFNTTT